MIWMNGADVRSFLLGRKLAAYDPDTMARAAVVTYHTDATCQVDFADGTRDQGEYGFSEEIYWTRYRNFRAGETHQFRLTLLRPDVAQAYFADGRIAYLQSPLMSLEQS